MKKLSFHLLTTALVTATSAALAATIPNPSFEADTFSTAPGYISVNAPITGWTANNNARAGINTSAGPFADNGAIPAGSKVAFIQSANTETPAGVALSTVISDLNIGTTYKVTFRVNARNTQLPKLKVEIDGATNVYGSLSSGGGLVAYKYFAFDFTATAASQTMTLRNDAAEDTTVLVDDFSIAPKNSGWSYAAWTDDATSGVDGSKTYTHAIKLGSATGTSINGINFTGVPGVNPSGPNYSLAGFPSAPINDANNVNSGGSQQLAAAFIYGQGTTVQTITLNGLLTGGEYVATIYSVAWETGTRAATYSVGGDRLTVNQDHYGDNNGITISYRFIATSSSVTLTITPLQSGTTLHAYGFSNYELSTPAVPTISLQPKSQEVGAGEMVTFTVAAGGSEPLFYQWRKGASDLPGENAPTLNLFSVTTNDNGVYSVVVSNAFDVAISSNATLRVGLPVVNRSFETDFFYLFPGYVSGNGPISGWTSLNNHGINPMAETLQSPFADNGVIPDGHQVAFLQGNGGLSQQISGFVPGSDYYVSYYENARSEVTVPAIEVKIGSQTIVPVHSRSPVGGVNSYVRIVSQPFTADVETMELTFLKTSPQGGDSTALIDNVVVFPIASGTAPSITVQPTPQTVQLGETATFSVSAFGSLPLTYQWRHNGSPIAGATGSSLVISNTVKLSEGNYSVVVSNSASFITSSNAFLTVLEPLNDMFNTGLDNSKVALAGGSSDSHYQLITNPDGPAPTNATVQTGIPAPPWLVNNGTSQWIGPRANTSASAVGQYVYRLTFNLTNRDPASVVIEGRWAVDNSGLGIRVNGVETGNVNNNGFGSWTTFVINPGNATFLPGLNTIDFVMANAAPAGFSGLRVEFVKSGARVLPNIAPVINTHPASQIVFTGDNVTLSVEATGSDPLTYQWFKNNSPLPGKTSKTLALTSLVECDSGDYTVTVVNNAGNDTSDPASVIVGYQRVPGIYGTGVNNDGSLAENGTVDLHYILGSSADPSFPGSEAFVVIDTEFPISTGDWLATGPKSKWIAPRADQTGTAGNIDGTYTYQTFIDLTGVDLSRFRLVGQWATDNYGVDILLNGVSTGNTSSSFGTWSPFEITSGFLSGQNSLDFVMTNAFSAAGNNPTAIRVDLTGSLDLRPRLTVTPSGPNQISVQWTTNPCHRLQSAPAVTGPWTTRVGAANPFITNTTSAVFFRVAP